MSIRNPENLFVRNELYFANKVKEPYNQTAFYYFHTISTISATLFGTFFICLLSYLITYKTPQHFRPYSKMVMLCVIGDSSIIISNFLFQVVSLLMRYFNEVLVLKEDVLRMVLFWVIFLFIIIIVI